MKPRTQIQWLAAAGTILLGLVGCRSTPSTSGAESTLGPEPGTAIFTLVLLRTGESPPRLTERRREELFDGHFAFMGDRAAEGQLLVSGPFGLDKAEDDLRGLFILDIDDEVRGLAVAQGDPTTQAGVFRQEAFVFATLDVLRQLPRLEQARQEERERAGEDLTQPDVRAYVILVAEDGERATSVLAHAAIAPSVILFGRLGPPRDGALLCVLSLEDAKEARARLAIANEQGIPIEVSEWYASPAFAQLAPLARWAQ